MFRRKLKAIANLAFRVFSTPRHQARSIMQENNFVDLCLAIARIYETDDREILIEAQEIMRILNDRKDQKRRDKMY